jgi:hypothetical protein
MRAALAPRRPPARAARPVAAPTRAAAMAARPAAAARAGGAGAGAPAGAGAGEGAAPAPVEPSAHWEALVDTLPGIREDGCAAPRRAAT